MMEPFDEPPPGALVPCRELVEELTDYLDGALPPERTALIDEHLTMCEGCSSVLAQLRTVVALAERVGPDDAVDALAPAARARLLAAFHGQP